MSAVFGMRIAMGKPYSQDLRERVIATGKILERASVWRRGFSWSVYRTCPRLLAVGARVVRRRRGSGGRDEAKLAAHDEALRARVTAYPDATLEELQTWLVAECAVKVSIGASGRETNF